MVSDTTHPYRCRPLPEIPAEPHPPEEKEKETKERDRPNVQEQADQFGPNADAHHYWPSVCPSAGRTMYSPALSLEKALIQPGSIMIGEPSIVRPLMTLNDSLQAHPICKSCCASEVTSYRGPGPVQVALPRPV